jgi:hypothetical protein
MRCQRCRLEEDRDVIAVKNLTKRYYEECMNMKAGLPSKLPETRCYEEHHKHEDLLKPLFDAQRRIDVGSPRSPWKPPDGRRGRAKAQNAMFKDRPSLTLKMAGVDAFRRG